MQVQTGGQRVIAGVERVGESVVSGAFVGAACAVLGRWRGSGGIGLWTDR
jgi:hypothetical protein